MAEREPTVGKVLRDIQCVVIKGVITQTLGSAAEVVVAKGGTTASEGLARVFDRVAEVAGGIAERIPDRRD